MGHSEAKIRDYLVNNISFISDDLTVIGKEYKLTITADKKWVSGQKVNIRGFIDILAQDNYGNYVIIEIKRSGKTAREAFGSEERYFLLRHSGSLANFDANVMNLLGLEYSSDLQVIRRDGTEIYQDIRLTSEGIHPASVPPKLYIDDFLKGKFFSFISELFTFYNQNIIM